MFKTILAFIKAHTIATAITATVVVSTAVATPIIINQVQKPEKEIETGQVQENIIDNTVIDDTQKNETPEENVIDENTLEENTVPEEEQKVEVSKEEPKKTTDKQEENKNQGTTTSNSNEKTNTTSENTWKFVVTLGGEHDVIQGVQYNSTTNKYRVILPGGALGSEEFTGSRSNPEIKQYIQWYEENINYHGEFINNFSKHIETYKSTPIMQTEINYKKERIETYTNSVISNGGNLNDEVVKATLEEFNRDLQKVINEDKALRDQYIKEAQENIDINKKQQEKYQSSLNKLLAVFK